MKHIPVGESTKHTHTMGIWISDIMYPLTAAHEDAYKELTDNAHEK